MKQKDLAELLGISPAAVTKLKKRGMPTDSLVRAQRWRKRHLEPSRVKGQRMETVPGKQPDPVAITRHLVEAALIDFEANEAALNAALENVPDERWNEIVIPESLKLKLFADDIERESAMIEEFKRTADEDRT